MNEIWRSLKKDLVEGEKSPAAGFYRQPPGTRIAFDEFAFGQGMYRMTVA